MPSMVINPTQVDSAIFQSKYDSSQSGPIHSLVRDSNGNLIGVETKDSNSGKVVWSNDGGASWSVSSDHTANDADNAGAGGRHSYVLNIDNANSMIVLAYQRIAVANSSNYFIERWAVTYSGTTISGISHTGPDTTINYKPDGNSSSAFSVRSLIISPNTGEMIVMYHESQASAYTVIFRVSTTVDSYKDLSGTASSLTLDASTSIDDMNDVMHLQPATNDLWVFHHSVGQQLGAATRFVYNAPNWTTPGIVAGNFDSGHNIINGTSCSAVDSVNNILYYCWYSSTDSKYHLVKVGAADSFPATLSSLSETLGAQNPQGPCLMARQDGKLVLIAEDDNVFSTSTSRIFYAIYNPGNDSWTAQTQFPSAGDVSTVTGTAVLESGDYTVRILFTKSDNTLNFMSISFQPVTAGAISGPTYLDSGQSGTYTVTVTGGQTPYTYSWSLGSATGTASSFTIAVKGSGTVSLTVTDATTGQSSASLPVVVVHPSIARNVILEADSSGKSTGRAWIDGKLVTLATNPGQISDTGPTFIAVNGLVDPIKKLLFIELPNGTTVSSGI